jgi:cAMP-binding proteins - catabolite gene activator and regulatory subunit of cAMP-dependent protein kinases
MPKPNPKLDNALASVPLFEGLTKRQLRKLATTAEVVDYMAAHSVVKEGENGDSFFVVLSGQAKVTVKGRTVNHILPGDHFGEISLLDGGPRTASVVSETPMTMLMITRANFLNVLIEDPQIAITLMESLARMIRRVDRSLAR